MASVRAIIDDQISDAWGSLLSTQSTSLHDFALSKDEWGSDVLLPQSWDRIKYKSPVKEELEKVTRYATAQLYLPHISSHLPLLVAFREPFADDPRARPLIERCLQSKSFTRRASVQSRVLVKSGYLGDSVEDFCRQLLKDVSQSLRIGGLRAAFSGHLKHFVIPDSKEEPLLELTGYRRTRQFSYSEDERHSAAVDYLKNLAEIFTKVYPLIKSPSLKESIVCFARDFYCDTAPELIPDFLELVGQVMGQSPFYISMWRDALFKAVSIPQSTDDEDVQEKWSSCLEFLGLQAWGILERSGHDLVQIGRGAVSRANLVDLIELVSTTFTEIAPKARFYFAHAYGAGIALLSLYNELSDEHLKAVSEVYSSRHNTLEFRALLGTALSLVDKKQVVRLAPLLTLALEDLGSNPRGIHYIASKPLPLELLSICPKDLKDAFQSATSWTDRVALTRLLQGTGETSYLMSQLNNFQNQSDLPMEEYRALLDALLHEARSGAIDEVLPVLLRHVQEIKQNAALPSGSPADDRNYRDGVLLKYLWRFGALFPETFCKVARESGFSTHQGVRNWLQTLHDEEEIYSSIALLSWIGELHESFIGALTQTDNPFVVSVLCSTLAERWRELSMHDCRRISFILSRVIQRTVHPAHRMILKGWSNFFKADERLPSCSATITAVLEHEYLATNTMTMLLDQVRVIGNERQQESLHKRILNQRPDNHRIDSKYIINSNAWLLFHETIERRIRI